METAEEQRVHSPPASLVPRLHMLYARPLPHNNPLLPLASLEDNSACEDSLLLPVCLCAFQQVPEKTTAPVLKLAAAGTENKSFAASRNTSSGPVPFECFGSFWFCFLFFLNFSVISSTLSEMSGVRSELLTYFTHILLGDALAAEYLILHLISDVYVTLTEPEKVH